MSVLICDLCESLDIRKRQYVNVNTGEILEDNDHMPFCAECGNPEPVQRRSADYDDKQPT